MKQLLLSCSFLAITFISYSQTDIGSFVRQKAIAIASIDQDNSNFSDLEQIGNAIGDARIVMLGEQDHGDAPAFAAKARIINYLHTVKGFNVIAFESDLFSATYGFENVAKTKPDFLKYYKANLYPYWTLCDACNSLFTTMIPGSFTTKNPYIIAGFDNQMYMRYSGQNMSGIIDSVARASSLDIIKDENLYKDILSEIAKLTDQFTVAGQKKEFYKKSMADLLVLKNQFATKFSSNDLWSLLIDNLICLANEILIKDGNFTEFANLRDLQMAKNLAWLCTTKYPNEKIIVWGANYHISKFLGHFNKNSMNKDISMATEFVKDEQLNAKTYVLGFSSYDGTAGRIGTPIFTLNSPDKNGFETWIPDSLDYAFVNFKDFNEADPQYNKEFQMKSSVTDQGVHKSHAAQWNRMFDGVFFIRHMYPCKIKG